MFDLNQAITGWRKALSAQPGFRSADLDELEDHLRETIAELRDKGLEEEEAFLIAARRLGDPRDLSSELAIADPVNRRRFRLRWMVTGALALVFLWLASGFLIGVGASTVHVVTGNVPALPVAGGGLLIGLTRLVLLILGVVLIWKLLASDGGSRKLGSLGAGSILLAAFLLAFLVLVTRTGPNLMMTRALGTDAWITWNVANGWVNLVLWLALPSLLLVGLWKLVRR